MAGGRHVYVEREGHKERELIARDTNFIDTYWREFMFHDIEIYRLLVFFFFLDRTLLRY